MCRQCKILYPVILISALVFATPVCALAQSAKTKTAASAAPASAGSGGNGLQRRIDFGNSYILGQSIKSGAVYLLHRKKSEIKSMLHYRENYHDEILESFTVDADSQLGPSMGPAIDTENLEPMKTKRASKKKTVLK